MKGYLTEGFLHYEFGGLIFGGAYTRRGLFSEFYGIYSDTNSTTLEMRRKLFQVNFRKDFWDCHWRQGKNWPIAGQHISNDNPMSLCKRKLGQGSFPHLKWQMGLALSILLNPLSPNIHNQILHTKIHTFP